MTTRRSFLRGAAAFGGAGVFSSALPGFSALAQAGGDYRALVCVFLAGGMDGHDGVVPSDAAGYAEWSASRERLLSLYAEAGDATRERDGLLPLGTQADGRAMGLVPQLGGFHDRYAEGNAVMLANVGPLVVPTTGAEAREKRVPLPPRLMSHNDQQSVWQSLRPEGATSGWGGRMADVLAASRSPFSAISVSGNPVFLAGETSRPFVMSAGGVRQVHATTGDWAYGGRGVPDALAAHLSASAASMNSWIASDYQAARRENVAAINELAAMAGDTAEGEDVALEENGLSRQLAMVAKTISLRARLGVERQVFFVQMGGFDTHESQHVRLPGLQRKLADAMSSFYRWTERAGLASNVTTFTASDFGRTLTTNASGTDHGWGGHHLVMGGALNGGRIVGSVPPAVSGHEQDFGRGRMVPTTSTLEYAASLGRWFGLSEGQLRDVLPGIENFGTGGAALF